MQYPFFTGKPENREKKEPVSWPVFRQSRMSDPKGYIVEEGLVDAVNVAIVLGQPLILTGEPGTGKTELASVINAEFGRKECELLTFETKSTSSARDLFYTYDAISHFHASRAGNKTIDALDYITYNALGKAILLANKNETVQQWLPKDFIHNGPRQSVVLIDEIDKAPRDFPNDLLNEIEGLFFRIPELANTLIELLPEMRPFIVITSNSEKHLSDAFLRRCVYYHIQFPDDKKLKEIIQKRVGNYVKKSDMFLTDAMSFFKLLRDPNEGIQKKPATAELLGWIIALVNMSTDAENPLRNNSEKVHTSLSVLVKNEEDLKRAHTLTKQWLKNQSNS